MIRRCRHPNKEIEGAIQYAEQNGWVFKDSGNSAHSWGKLLCPLHTVDGHIIYVWSTPRNAFNHAKQIRRDVDHCQHDESEEETL